MGRSSVPDIEAADEPVGYGAYLPSPDAIRAYWTKTDTVEF